MYLLAIGAESQEGFLEEGEGMPGFFSSRWLRVFRLRRRLSSRKGVENAGFGLLDTAISLAIAGVLAVGVLKGSHLITKARTISAADQASQLLLILYMNEELLASLGQGEAKDLWEQLLKSGLINSQMKNGYPASKAGGVFDISSAIKDRPGTWLVLTAEGGKLKGVLTPEQASSIDVKRDTGDPKTGSIQAIDGEEDSGKKCLADEKYNLSENTPACVLLFKIF